ncbi:MAG: hypothetical protein JWN82_97 [Candidatus Saccharibacteria bacterium]|nr:hypothetical protein [Candidatus Saccharibacteria bacterium]
MNPTLQRKLHEHYSQYPARHYPKGQIILFANEMPRYTFYIAEGRVRKYTISYRGDEIIVDLLKPQACFPISSVINKTPNRFFFKAEIDTTLHLVSIPDFVSFLQLNPDITMYLFSQLYRRLDGINSKMIHLMAGTARSRLLYELLAECRNFGHVQPDNSHDLRLKEIDLASLSGLSRETVNREIRRLKDEGWVEVRTGRIIVKNIANLEMALATTTPY